MRELLKNIAALPEVEIGQTPDDFKLLAERTLETKEKVIYYIISGALNYCWKHMSRHMRTITTSQRA